MKKNINFYINKEQKICIYQKFFVSLQSISEGGIDATNS